MVSRYETSEIQRAPHKLEGAHESIKDNQVPLIEISGFSELILGCSTVYVVELTSWTVPVPDLHRILASLRAVAPDEAIK